MTQLTLAAEGIDLLFGTRDENLRRIEEAFGVSVRTRLPPRVCSSSCRR